MDTFAATWPHLAASVRRGLLIGSEGKLHLMHLAQELLVGSQQLAPAAQRASLDLGLELLCAAWAKDPLDGQIAAQLLALHEKWPKLDAQLLPLVREVASRWRQPEDLRYYKRLAESRDAEKLRRFLRTQLGKEAGNFYWWQQALALAFYEQDQELIGDVLRQDWPQALDSCRKLVAGDWAVLSGQPEAAMTAYGRAMGQDAQWRRAQALYGSGQPDQARSLWGELLERAPWRVGEIMRLYDLVRPQENTRLDGQVAVALYSFNKAAELDATLASLADSDLGSSSLWVLDNGSSDHTCDVLRAWKERMGDGLHVISLHVNIGAPAARNWLMNVPEIRACRWMVYLDDDVDVPRDWLSTLGAAVAAYPDAGVWGCKVVDHAAPKILQSVDLHLIAPGTDEERQERRFRVSDLHHQTLDFGQFDYLRPCASVTGCCHLFRMDRLLESGGFDLRFSPSQYDDLEHDVRLNVHGLYAVYQGHLAVRHKKRTGKSSRTSPAEYGNSYANMHKLQKKYSAAEYERIMMWEADVLEQDFWRKREYVGRWLAGEA